MNIMSPTKATKKSSESPSTTTPPMLFSSLPKDLILNVLARVSRLHHPTLSLVSKSFRSLVASRELDATRSLIGKNEDYLYVCLARVWNPNPRWFVLAPTPKQQKLIPIPSLPPCEHSQCSTVLSRGSEIYIIGDVLSGSNSRRVLVLNCRSHQWRRLPNMHVDRETPTADVIDGKLYVIGGCKNKKCGEVYDSSTQTWEPLSPKTLDKLYLNSNCLVEIETNVLCEIKTSKSVLFWRYANKDSAWRIVEGLEELTPKSYFPSYLGSVANSGGRRVTVWWKMVDYDRPWLSYNKVCKTDIWCGEISFQRQGAREVKGVVEWSESVLTFENCDFDCDFVLDSAIITH